MATPPAIVRCPWCGDDPLYVAYHDQEWGVPCHDDRKLFEFLVLEGAQAGLSWLTILRKREAYRRAFDGFDAERIARYGEADVARLLADPGIVRNRLKVAAAIANARAFLATREQFGSFDAYLWRFVDGRQRANAWRTLVEVPAETPESRALSNRIQCQPGLSMPEFLKRYGTEPSCEAALEQARWPAGFGCPRCEGVTYSRVRGRTHALFQCQACRHPTSRIAGTVMQGSKLPLTTCFLAIYLISQAKTGLPAGSEVCDRSTMRGPSVRSRGQTAMLLLH